MRDTRLPFAMPTAGKAEASHFMKQAFLGPSVRRSSGAEIELFIACTILPLIVAVCCFGLARDREGTRMA
jgi:hypothetical protein